MKLKSVVTSLILLLIAYSAYWYYIAENAEEYVGKVIDELREEGLYITYEGFEIEGFPYRLILSLDSPVILKTNGDKRAKWQSDKLIIYAQPWNFTHLIFTANTSRLTYKNTSSSTPYNNTGIVVDSGSMSLSFNTPRDETTHISWELNNVNSSYNFDNRPIFSAGNIALHLRSASKEQIGSDNDILAPKLADFALGAVGLSIGETSANKSIDEVTFVSSLRGGEVPSLTQSGFKNWSESGGTLEISQLKIIIGEFDILADGSVTLDAQLRPLGALSTRLKAPHAASQIVSRFAGLNDDAKATLLSSLTLLDAFSGGEGIPLSLTAQNGALWLGPLRISELGPIL